MSRYRNKHYLYFQKEVVSSFQRVDGFLHFLIFEIETIAQKIIWFFFTLKRIKYSLFLIQPRLVHGTANWFLHKK